MKSDKQSGFAEIVPPNQPEHWLLHARFDHFSHRAFDCRQCHGAVLQSRPERESEHSHSAADVLLPRIADCQSCHISTTGDSRTMLPDAQYTTYPVVSSCVMCHVYHRREKSTVKEPLVAAP